MALRLGQPRDELLARMSSQELAGWMALFEVHAEEVEHARNVAESGDGQVIYDRPTESDDDDTEDGDER